MSERDLEFYKREYDRVLTENHRLETELELSEYRRTSAEENLARIKNSFAWKLTKPVRAVRVAFIRMAYYKTPKNLAKKIIYKKRLEKAYVLLGTESFPSEEEGEKQRNTKFDKMPLISILVPLYNTPEKFLREMIESVLVQTYGNFELCLADGSDEEHSFVGDICKDYASKDKRVVYKKLEKNEGISGNTNRCVELSTGEYIGLFDHDDILHPSALYEYVKVINEQNADYIYCDEITFEGESINDMITLHFKPDYAIDTLRANNYICHFSVFKRSLLKETELFRKEYDGSQDHDMILRLTSLAENVVHVPKILYYWRSHPGSVASDISAKYYAIDAAKRAVQNHLESYGIYNTIISSTRAFPTIFKLDYEILEKKKVSVIIPNKDNVEMLSKCLEALKKQTYENVEIIIAENNSVKDETFKYYEQLKSEGIKVIKYDGYFNFSAINNMAVSKAEGDYLLLLNNDVVITTDKFIEELLMYAQRKDVGAVGCKLLFPNGTIQHGGIIIGLGADRIAGHIHYGMQGDYIGYMGRLCYAQNMSAVTAAAMMVNKDKYLEVGGMDEELAVAYNDVDFCLKLREKGYLNIFTPFAEATHYESASRDSYEKDAAGERFKNECQHFKDRWQEVIDKGDPYYNPNFSLNVSDYSLKIVVDR